MRCLASNNPADASARSRKVVARKQRIDIPACLGETLRGNRKGKHERGNKTAPPGKGKTIGEIEHKRRHLIGNEQHDQHEQCPASELPRVGILFSIKQALEPADEPADEHDRMEPRLRITDDGVDKESEDGNLHALPSMMAASFSISRLLRTVSARRS